MPVAIKGSGGGSVTLDAGAAAANTTLTLPNTTGTVLQSGTAVTAAQGGTGLTSPGTNGNVLTSDGTAWTSAAATAPAALSTASGSAPSYSARAWVNFNGTGTVAIRGSGNVSSITDNGVGDYTVNFTTAMPDANYSITGMTTRTNYVLNVNSAATPTASAIRLANIDASTAGLVDVAYLNVAIFR